MAAYEDLRRRTLMGSTGGGHFGVVLLREGMAAWIARGAVASVATRPAPDADRRVAAPVLSDELHAGVVKVLAGMALSGRREMNS